MRRLVLLVLFLTVIVGGCLGQAENSKTPSSSSLTPQDTKHDVLKEGQEKAVVEGINAFAIDLYMELAKENDNLFFSPYSVGTALAMAYEGATGVTREDMGKVLHLPDDNETMWTGFKHLVFSLQTANGSPYVLRTANALWVQRGYPINEGYLKIIREFYLGEVGEVDFVKDPNGAAREINGWVEERTNGRIRDIVSKPSGDTRLIITNAVYFRANWSSRFDGGTWNGTFHSPKGPVTVPMMHQTGKFPYFENDELQALELPYKGGRLGMLIILPEEGKFDEVEKELSTGFIWEIMNGTTKESVKVTPPKFRLEETYRLRNTLMEMGMEKAFTVPDFSGISPKGELAISDVVHKTFLSVAENGTEAAAATAVTITLAAAPAENLKVFNANRPFIFLIYDRETGAVLFMGRLVNPGE